MISSDWRYLAGLVVWLVFAIVVVRKQYPNGKRG